MVHVQHGVLILYNKVFARFSNGALGVIVLVLYITCKHLPLFVVTCTKTYKTRAKRAPGRLILIPGSSIGAALLVVGQF